MLISLKAGRASSKHTTANLAESFCLQAPFLTLASIEDNEDRHGNSTGHQRKRRRRSGSGTSYLEPAAAAPVNRRSPGPETRIKRRKTSGRYSDSASDVPSDSDSSSSSSSAGIPEKLVKDYGRRARHKTREDRYESKAIKKAEKKKEKDTKSSSKRKRKRRSGAQFVHHDDTKTISKNRLTVHNAVTLHTMYMLMFHIFS